MLGRLGQFACELCVIVYCFGSCITFLIIVGDQGDSCKFATRISGIKTCSFCIFFSISRVKRQAITFLGTHLLYCLLQQLPTWRFYKTCFPISQFHHIHFSFSFFSSSCIQLVFIAATLSPNFEVQPDISSSRTSTVLFLLNAPALLNAPHKIFQERMLEAYLPLPAQKCVQSRHFKCSSPLKNTANISTYIV